MLKKAINDKQSFLEIFSLYEICNSLQLSLHIRYIRRLNTIHLLIFIMSFSILRKLHNRSTTDYLASLRVRIGLVVEGCFLCVARIRPQVDNPTHYVDVRGCNPAMGDSFLSLSMLLLRKVDTLYV